jgi:SlyX protein
VIVKIEHLASFACCGELTKGLPDRPIQGGAIWVSMRWNPRGLGAMHGGGAVPWRVLRSNVDMDAQDTEPRLIDLEIKLSFQEDLIEQLNQVVVRHQQQIDALTREVLALRHSQGPDSGAAGFRSLRDELPPHY